MKLKKSKQVSKSILMLVYFILVMFDTWIFMLLFILF